MIKLFNKIKSLIRFCQIISSTNPNYVMIADINPNINIPAQNFKPYGLQSNTPISSAIQGLELQINADPNNKAVIFTDSQNIDGYNGQPESLNALAVGEISLGIPALTTRWHFLANGMIELIYNGTAGSTSPDYLVKYNELLTAFNQLKSDFNSLISVFNSHVHNVVGSNGGGPVVFVPVGTTAGSTTSGSNTTANMTSSKLSAIEVPNV